MVDVRIKYLKIEIVFNKNKWRKNDLYRSFFFTWKEVKGTTSHCNMIQSFDSYDWIFKSTLECKENW